MPSIRIAEFDTWRPGYGFAQVSVELAGTNTLAPLFSDEALTTPATNPQTLIEKTAGGISYGKFSAPLYTGQAYELSINSVDRTGVEQPALTTLDDQDASQATVNPTGGAGPLALADLVVERVDVRNYGIWTAVGEQGASAATNTATLLAAIGAAASNGGGYVEIPAGTFQVNQVTLPPSVVLRGAGRGATIVQSLAGGNVLIISGARAGLSRLTLDGVSQVTGAVGVFAEDVNQIILEDCEVKRFSTGILRRGGSNCHWRDLYVNGCLTGYEAQGNSDAGLGGPLEFNLWDGGAVELNLTFGVELKWVDQAIDHNIFKGVEFDNNTGAAVHLVGARKTVFRDCEFTGNIDNFTVEDGSPLQPLINSVIGVEVNGGSFNGGTIKLSGTLQSFAFRKVDFTGVAVTLSTPLNNVLVEDCREISGNTIGGNLPTAWLRHKTYDRGNTSGLTTGSVATRVWGITLKPGQVVSLEAKVIGRGRSVDQQESFHIGASARQPSATLAYKVKTVAFTAGNVVTGQSSGATARICANTDAGATGTLNLQDIVGTFQDNEIITDTGGGSATVNGLIATSSTTLLGSVTSIRAAAANGASWAATFVANGTDIELQVTGAASTNVEWTADVDVVSS